MNKYNGFFICIFVFLPFLVGAQSYPIDKGSMIIGGSAGFQSMGGEELRGDERTTIFTIAPQFYYFVAPNISVGATLSYQSISRGDDSDSATGIGPGIFYFFGDENSKTFPFLGVNYMYTSDKDSYTKNDINLIGGAAFMIAKNVAITGSAFYMIESYSPDGSDESFSGNTFGVQFGVDVFVF